MKLPGSERVLQFGRQIFRRARYFSEFNRFLNLQREAEKRFDLLEWKYRYPCLNDRKSVTPFDRHYTYHPAWAARILAELRPSRHIDIASSLTFCTMVSAFIPVEFYDYRPAMLALSNLECKRGDLAALPFPDHSVESLSCMHVVEHVGLGRYGDPLDPDGDLKAIAELKRVLKPKGSLLFVTPVGKPNIRFNAHRIYSYDQVVSYFSGLHVQQFALVDDSGQFTLTANPAYANVQNYGCGCWWFVK